MTALIVIGIILAILIGILLIKASITIEYSEKVTLSVKVLFLKIGILPKKPKKRIKYKKFTDKKYRKLLEKKKLRETKKQKKKQKKSAKKAGSKQMKKAEKLSEKHNKRSLLENIELIRLLIAVVTGRFTKHLRIKLTKIKLVIASDDAAKTAVLYGAASGGVACILEMLDNITNVKYTSDAEVSVDADFLAVKPTADVKIEISLRVWHLFDVLIRAAHTFIANK